VVGSNLRHEMPLLAHRIRKAAMNRGARVAFLNPREYDYLFPVAGYSADQDLVSGLAAVVRAAAAAAGKPVPSGVREAVVGDAHRALAAALGHGEHHAIFLGALTQRHPAYAEIRSLAAALAELSGASLGLVTDGANTAGAYLAGAVPHRESGGTPVAAPGLSARAMLENRLKAYVLFGGIDPANDLAGPTDALAGAELVIAATTHLTEKLREVAHVVLPVGTFAESAGTFVNVEGRWQSWSGAASPVGESRPGWKVLRVLANLLNIRGVDYVSSEEVREALKKACGSRLTQTGNDARFDGVGVGSAVAGGGGTPSGPWVDIPPYQIDVLVRGSESLAKTKDGQLARVVL
jgi:NADH-quinone oxidoreductase subunit G